MAETLKTRSAQHPFQDELTAYFTDTLQESDTNFSKIRMMVLAIFGAATAHAHSSQGNSLTLTNSNGEFTAPLSERLSSELDLGNDKRLLKQLAGEFKHWIQANRHMAKESGFSLSANGEIVVQCPKNQAVIPAI